MARVWIVNAIRDNISPAQPFGEFKFINIRYVYGDEITDDQRLPSEFCIEMDKAVLDFNPKDDYLLIAGDHLQLVAFTARLTAVHGSFRVLRWDRQAQGYIPVQIP